MGRVVSVEELYLYLFVVEFIVFFIYLMESKGLIGFIELNYLRIRVRFFEFLFYFFNDFYVKNCDFIFLRLFYFLICESFFKIEKIFFVGFSRNGVKFVKLKKVLKECLSGG